MGTILRIKGFLAGKWYALHSSYWFLPAVFAVLSIASALVLVEVSRSLDLQPLAGTEWLFANEPDGARALLSTIAGSMITVAGVTFSITISTVALTSGQFGPRLLGNFMQDVGNQVTLGTFIGTFLYCLMVLRAVHGGEGPNAFVPHLAILWAIVLALASVAVLIYFIHHVPASIHISNVIARIGKELQREVFRRFHSEDETPKPSDDDVETIDRLVEEKGARDVFAAGRGYLQSLSHNELVDIGKKHDVTFALAVRPGAFVNPHDVIAKVWPAERVDDVVLQSVQKTYTLGHRRTEEQDVLFLVDQLCEISARALSPGTNDPYTAIDCLHWLAEPLVDMARGTPPPHLLRDDDKTLRVVADALTFERTLRHAFEALRPYVQTDRLAATEALRILEKVLDACLNDEQRRAVLRQVTELQSGCERCLPHTVDKDAMTAAAERLLKRSGLGLKGALTQAA